MATPSKFSLVAKTHMADGSLTLELREKGKPIKSLKVTGTDVGAFATAMLQASKAVHDGMINPRPIDKNRPCYPIPISSIGLALGTTPEHVSLAFYFGHAILGVLIPIEILVQMLPALATACAGRSTH